MTPPYPAKVTIVGPGKVGMSLASYLMTSGVAREIVLVGSNTGEQDLGKPKLREITHAHGVQLAP